MSGRSSRKLFGCCIAVLAVANVPLLSGQTAPGPQAPGAGAAAAGAVENPRAKFDEVTKGMQSVGGLITFYRNSPDDESKDHTRLLAAIPKSLLNQDLMLSGTMSRGPQFGLPIDDGTLVRWVQSGNRLILVAPDTRLKETGSAPVIGAVRNTYTDTLLGGFPVLATDPSGGWWLICPTRFIRGWARWGAWEVSAGICPSW